MTDEQLYRKSVRCVSIKDVGHDSSDLVIFLIFIDNFQNKSLELTSYTDFMLTGNSEPT